MSSALFRVILFGLQELLINSPDLFLRLKKLFERSEVTIQDLKNLQDEIERKTYSSIVTNTKLP